MKICFEDMDVFDDMCNSGKRIEWILARGDRSGRKGCLLTTLPSSVEFIIKYRFDEHTLYIISRKRVEEK